VGQSNLPYRQLISWEFPEYNDVYLINMQSGDHELVLTKLQYAARLSPEGRYLYWWDRSELEWYVKDVRSGAPVQVSAGIPHAVHNEDHDWPFDPYPYGSAGWTADDEHFLVYDRHDIWALDPEGGEPVNITDGYGRSNNLRLRYVDLDREEESIQPEANLLLSAFHYENKQSGYYRDRVTGGQSPEELIFMQRRFAGMKQADDAETLLYTRESFQEFPDLWVASPDFRAPEKLSDVNPQQSEYLWGSAELVRWRSLDGEQLQGILYTPENFHPDSTYPMLTYFYEKNSDNLYRHWAPEAHRSIINFTFYASRGYVIFVPDIPYQIGYPGESALDAVLPGVSQLMAEPWVDAENLGVQGHSWGGYQIAYLVTQTDIFKCAEAGAPVSNMVSAYGGIRWGSGMSRMFQYEQTQSRIGGSLWEYPLRYIENSPIFFADKINTPLLILHNDQDGAVPWYQGMELFVALRRLNKPAWMINYNNEPHWPVKYQNRVDWAKRMQTYFDHYLKGAPAPVWLEQGIPATEKGETLGFEVTGE
jgi:dipeptidyl aminopeptidase/acylaminoacyl peptidase